MKQSAVRIGLYTLVAAIFAAALRLTPALPDAPQAGDLLVSQAGEGRWKLRVDTVGRRENLRTVLQRGGLSDGDIAQALQAIPKAQRFPDRLSVTFRSDPADSIPSEIVLQLRQDRLLLHLRRDTTGSWSATQEVVQWKTDTILVSGTIKSNLTWAVDSSTVSELPPQARRVLANTLAGVYEYKVDMSRDLRRGDEFKVMVLRSIAPSGAVRIDSVLAASFKLSGKVLKAIRFDGGEFYDETGKSMRAAFLRTPIEFGRITSGFGGRMHPILGQWKMHTGTDYGADAGTPVRAIGDGVVVRRGWGNGYGNVLEIRHPINGIVTRYGHLSRFETGVQVGTRVKIGQTVAYVGSTGLATGPHLHFEVLIGGEQRNPRNALPNVGAASVPAKQFAEFKQASTMLLGLLETPMSSPIMRLATEPYHHAVALH